MPVTGQEYGQCEPGTGKRGRAAPAPKGDEQQDEAADLNGGVKGPKPLHAPLGPADLVTARDDFARMVEKVEKDWLSH